MDRRQFLRTVAGLGGISVLQPLIAACARSTPAAPSTPTASAARAPVTEQAEPLYNLEEEKVARVAFVKTEDRVEGIARALEMLGLGWASGKNVFLKPNLNSADPFPGSTHRDTLRALVQELKAAGAARITVADRSGMGDTRAVMEKLGVFRMAEELGFDTLVLNELGRDGWRNIDLPGSHWKRGFAIPNPMIESDAVVQTCCLKTHRFGGHFTLSLKNSVGLAAKKVPGEGYDYMEELHDSPNQRFMIAEINAVYKPELVLLDAMEGFAEGGPDTGRLVKPGVILASDDRVALDAVGVAILRQFGTTPAVSKGAVFGQDQIAQAVQLKIGVDSPEKIQLLTPDTPSDAYAARIREILVGG